jgi:hypothetical protein
VTSYAVLLACAGKVKVVAGDERVRSTPPLLILRPLPFNPEMLPPTV